MLSVPIIAWWKTRQTFGRILYLSLCSRYAGTTHSYTLTDVLRDMYSLVVFSAALHGWSHQCLLYISIGSLLEQISENPRRSRGFSPAPAVISYLRNKTCFLCLHGLVKAEANVWENSRADQWKPETQPRVFTCSRIPTNFAEVFNRLWRLGQHVLSLF